MPFVVRLRDVHADRPGRSPERVHHAPPHPAFLAEHGDRAVATDALCPSPTGAPPGGLRLTEAPGKDAAEALRRTAPFRAADPRESARVRHRAKALRPPVRADRATAAGTAGASRPNPPSGSASKPAGIPTGGLRGAA